jgi:hypothetical protein
VNGIDPAMRDAIEAIGQDRTHGAAPLVRRARRYQQALSP